MALQLSLLGNSVIGPYCNTQKAIP